MTLAQLPGERLDRWDSETAPGRTPAHETGEVRATGALLASVGLVAQHYSDYDRAEMFLRESLMLFQEVGDRYGLAATFDHLGLVAERKGALEQASELYRAARALRRISALPRSCATRSQIRPAGDPSRSGPPVLHGASGQRGGCP